MRIIFSHSESTSRNKRAGWWWADPLAAYVLAFYALPEVYKIFFTDGG